MFIKSAGLLIRKIILGSPAACVHSKHIKQYDKLTNYLLDIQFNLYYLCYVNHLKPCRLPSVGFIG